MENYDFAKVEILPGGIGYLRFDSFARGKEAFETAVAAMNFLGNCIAVFFDLRYNESGTGTHRTTGLRSHQQENMLFRILAAGTRLQCSRFRR